MIRPYLAALALAGLTWGIRPSLAADLEKGFSDPPPQTRPWVYWYWISDQISREGITRDLEAMKRVGIGEALIGNIFLEDVQRGRVKALTDEWWSMVEHAIREGARVGVDIGMFNCPGWSQSGGPWIKPEQAMRYLVASERRVRGPMRFEGKIEAPAQPFQDVAWLAFPEPESDQDTLASRRPEITCDPPWSEAGLLTDGNAGTEATLPDGVARGSSRLVLDFTLEGPMVARSLVVHPGRSAFTLSIELLAQEDSGAFTPVRSCVVDRSNVSVGVGFMPHGPVAVAFPERAARRWRVVLSRVGGKPSLAEIELTGAARVERYIEKQLAKMHPTPLPAWDTYLWPQPQEPSRRPLVVQPGAVVDLARHAQADGTLRWEVPAGRWVIQRLGMTPTGTRNAPASPEGQGFEVDKMNRAAAQAHFDAFIGRLLARMPARERRAFKHVVADSYEMGSQNWTDGFGELFLRRCGYDPQPWFPVLSGRIVGSSDQSERFLWDLRRLVADHVAFDYVGGLRDACQRHGLKLWLENYGHWGFPAEFLQYGGQADQVSGEFWATGDLGSIELRAASSAAHIYGKPIISAEAFTSVLKFESTPWTLKKRGDWALTEGINHWVLHVYIHQPFEDRRPGVNAWFSTEFNRHNTWFEAGRAWIDYYRRCHFLLQQGLHVADVAYFIGEDAPKMTGVRRPELPSGHDYDYINGEVMLERLQAREGRWVLPDGQSYRLLVLPELDTMRPELLRKLRALVAAGGAILGQPPVRSPSMKDYPACDEEVKRLAADIWESCDGTRVKAARYGKGRVFRGLDLRSALDAMAIGPDVQGADPRHILWTHRATRDTDIYFLCNQSDRPLARTLEFRVKGRVPEFWDPVSGRRVRSAMFDVTPTGVRALVSLEPRGSVFVVFREAAGGESGVVAVHRNGKALMNLTGPAAPSATPTTTRASMGAFTMAGWVKPAVEVALPAETNGGVFLQLPRNDAVAATHGDTLQAGGGHAGAGVSVGRNGVVVFEHGANYFAPVLSHSATIEDWTHVAVVYRDNQPTLYLNGRVARQGLRSRYTVHSSAEAGQGSGGTFKGDLGGFEHFGRALGDADLAEAVRLGPPVGADVLPDVELWSGGRGRFQALVARDGDYEVYTRRGTVLTRSVGGMPEALPVGETWDVRFPAAMDVPDWIQLSRLESLSVHTNIAIRHFSGTVAYTTTFSVPARMAINDIAMRHVLDLGQVESMAEVVLNGRNLGILWKPPFRLDVSGILKPSGNTLEVRVTGTWRNRLIGDAKYPQGFPGGGPLQFKPSLTAHLNLSPNEPLAPYGLIGPVRLHAVRQVFFE